MIFDWYDKEYSFDIPEIDDQHKGIFQLAGQLDTAVREGHEEPILRVLFVEISKHIDLHFATEEALMERVKYPKIKTHKKEHEGFRKNIKDALDKIETETETLGLEVLFTLNDWIKKHITTTDQDLKTFIQISSA